MTLFFFQINQLTFLYNKEFIDLNHQNESKIYYIRTPFSGIQYLACQLLYLQRDHKSKDCLITSNCQWSSQDNIYTCFTYQETELICTEYSDQSSCDEATTCAWTNGGTCQTYLQHCSYYTVTAAEAYLCSKKDSSCSPGKLKDGEVTCTDGALECENISDQSICTALLAPSKYSYCYWDTSCKTLDYSKCSNLNQETICVFYGCLWKNNSCQGFTCSGINSQEKCISNLRADSIYQAQLCQWTNSTCTDLIPNFTQSTCYSQSYGTYAWDGLFCNACFGNIGNSWSSIIYLTIFILL